MNQDCELIYLSNGACDVCDDIMHLECKVRPIDVDDRVYLYVRCTGWSMCGCGFIYQRTIKGDKPEVD